ncbi:hypothetical protein B0H16DRAFT_1771004 [Mycena metata]|uniref:F-box domain-containing protein n=1 Tax=Mycena metata TaxID=1033252 RepID=A0AAD7JXG8_9AGAR|nr:hypothetical protein B0H16DRAFT_1771004 [Mycena metata]
MAIQLLDLPPELLILILSSLNLFSLASCLATNRRVKSIIDGSTWLQYRLAAQAYFTEFFRNPSSVRNIEMNWQDFTDVLTYALSGGIFAAADVDSGTLKWFSLAAKEPVVHQLGLQGCIQDLALAVPEDDLLAVVSTFVIASKSTIAKRTRSRPLDQGAKSVKMHFYEMATQSAHRLARKPVVKVPRIRRLGKFVSDARVDICGSKIALLVHYADSEPPSRLLIYDWKQGRLLMDFFGHFSIARFLSLDVVVLAERDTGSLKLWTIQENPQDVVACPRICLRLPQLEKPGGKYIVFDAESNPKGSGSLSSQEPFHSSFTDSILLFQVLILLEDQETELLLDLVVSRRALLQLLPSAEEPSIELSWKQWGPPIARWLGGGSGSDNWAPITCGQRLASVDPLTGCIRLLDFNPYTYRKLSRKQMDDTGESTAVCTLSGTETNVVNRLSPGIFGEEIASQLGCIVADSPAEAVYNGVLLEGKWIVGVKDTLDVDGKLSFDLCQY